MAKVVVLFLIVICSVGVWANESVEWLSSYAGELTAGSETVIQNFNWIDSKKGQLEVLIQKIDKKGKSVEFKYVLHLADIDEKALQFKPTGNYVTIYLRTQLAQKFMVEYEGDQIKAYLNEISLFTDKIEKARSIIETIKLKIPESRNSIELWQSTSEALDWIDKHVTAATRDGVVYAQECQSSAENYLVQLKRNYSDNKGGDQLDEMNFHLMDVDISKAMLKISGNQLSIEVETRDNLKYIGIASNEETQDYANSLEIFVDDLEQARNLIHAIRYTVPKVKEVRRTITGINDALDYVKCNVGVNKIDNDKYEQKLTLSGSNRHILSLLTIHTNEKEELKERKEEVYWVDLEPRPFIHVSGKRVEVVLQLKDDKRFVKVEENGEMQSFANKAVIYANSIEQARDIVHGLSYVIDKDVFLPEEFSSNSQAVSWLQTAFGKLKLGDKIYEQRVVVDPVQDNVMVLTRKTLTEKADVNEVLKLYPQDINACDLQIDVSGKEMYVDVSTGKLKYVEHRKEDTPQSYDNEARFYFDEAGNAKSFIAAIKFLNTKMANVKHGFNSQQEALDYLEKNIQIITLDTDEYDQKFEFNIRACKVNYTNVNSDSKGKYNEWVYEWNSTDIDKNLVHVYVSGKHIGVRVGMRGKNKLIKPYKNGDPQRFVSNVEVHTDGVLAAKRMREAFIKIGEECRVK